MAIDLYIPMDATALSLGADETADAIRKIAGAQKADIRIIRNGSPGLFWLEPLVEVVTPQGRIAYGPVMPEDVDAAFVTALLTAGEHKLRLGKPEDLDYLKKQQRVTFERCGITDPVSIPDYLAHGGYRGLKNALATEPAEIVKAVTESGLRGRGGARVPAGIQWAAGLNAPAEQKYIVCNADEGDSGTFADRMIMEGDPFLLIEGMTIAGLAVGATKGFVYIRSEYPHAFAQMNLAIEAAKLAGYLGENIQ